MSGLKAALYKDLKLFFRRTGLAVLLLPLALLLALQFGLTDSGAQSYLQPFPVAVRDEDNTIMSRSLVAQMSRIQVFSQILRAEDGEGARGADAVCEGAAGGGNVCHANTVCSSRKDKKSRRIRRDKQDTSFR